MFFFSEVIINRHCDCFYIATVLPIPSIISIPKSNKKSVHYPKDRLFLKKNKNMSANVKALKLQ